MSKIPLIAVTPEAEEDDDHNYIGMTDTLTDVESLDSETDNIKPKRRPKLANLKIKITNSGGITDVEDFDVSDCEDNADAIAKRITLGDLDASLDAAQTEETCKSKSKGITGKRRLHTQFSITTGDNAPVRNYLTLNEPEQGLTDVEDIDASDNEENVPESPDYTITEEMLENTVLTKIAVKVHGGKSEFPAPPKTSLTDTEILDSDSDEQNTTKKLRRRKPRTHRHTNRASEILQKTGRNTADDEKSTLEFIKRNPVTTITIPQTHDVGDTDVEVLNSSADEMPVTILRLNVTDTDHEFITDDEAYNQHREYHNIPLPEPYRKRVDLREESNGAPSVKVVQLSGSYVTDTLAADAQGETGEEAFSDAEMLLVNEPSIRGPTPDIPIFDECYEHATETYKERSRTPIVDNLTDTEYLAERPAKQKATQELDDTDVENVAMSDVEEIDRIRAMSVTPSALCEIGAANILSKEGEGPVSASARIAVNKRVAYVVSTTVTPVATDTEDVYASATDDDAVLRADVDLPDSSSHVHLHSGSKINLDAHEVMYLKGGDGLREVYTDVEDINVSDSDDDHECKYKKKVSVDILGNDNLLVSTRDSCHTSAIKKNGIDWDASRRAPAERQISKKGDKPLDAVHKGWQASPDATSPRTSVPFRETHEERSPEDPERSISSQSGQQQRQVPDQHQLSEEMKRLLQDMENESKK